VEPIAQGKDQSCKKHADQSQKNLMNKSSNCIYIEKYKLILLKSMSYCHQLLIS